MNPVERRDSDGIITGRDRNSRDAVDSFDVRRTAFRLITYWSMVVFGAVLYVLGRRNPIELVGESTPND